MSSIEMQLVLDTLDTIVIYLVFISVELGIIMGMAVGIYARLSKDS